jgi:SAM-dependent methyltransferase
LTGREPSAPSEDWPEALQAAADHWDARGHARAPSRRFWWQHPTIVRHINKTICGRPAEGIAEGDVLLLEKRLAGRRLDQGVSVGCGHGAKEMSLLLAGVVDHFHLFEISGRRVDAGRERAERLGLEGRITWHREIADFTKPSLEVDLVYWNNALHHMLDTARSIEWSRAILRPGGILYVNDFVGPDRMQWSDETLEIASRVRACLPERLLRAPDGSRLPRRVGRPDPEALAANDPTECADSAAITRGIRRHFPAAAIKPTGGLVYQLALKGVLENLGDDDAGLLELLLVVDDLCATQGLTHYAVAVAEG